MLGEQNENFIIVEKGLEKGEEVYISLPENAEKFTLSGSELIPEIKARLIEQKQKEKKAKAENQESGNKLRKPQGRGAGMPNQKSN